MDISTGKPKNVLHPVVAGRFYPSDAKTLSKDIRSYLEHADIQPAEIQVLAVLSPHAGYVFSGPVAGYSFKYVEKQNPDTVLVIGLCHNGVQKACVFKGDGCETPLGSIPVDSDFAESLISGDSPIYSAKEPFLSEHSIEVNLPFIQTVFPNAKVVPVLITDTERDLCSKTGKKIAQAIKANPDKKVLIVISSDMSHYPSYEFAGKVDMEMLKSLETLNPETIYNDFFRLNDPKVSNLHCVMCGSAAMLTVVEAVREFSGVKGRILHYNNSGDSPYGDHGRVVGYASFAMEMAPH